MASNIGLVLNVHYCKGEVSSVTLAYRQQEPCNPHHESEEHKHQHKADNKACCAIKAENHKKCCKDDVVKLQDKNEGKVIVKSLQLDLGAFCVAEEWKPSQFYYTVPVAVKDSPSFYCESHAPPLFKLYCKYILYA
ncbi:hypothetical protein [Trichocoleus sp. FACHB-40]|uniref:HYC_CC_PP family protein n=1 Tax=Trichocoleus sp. FACHB-40 TaxID=2692870 RepID=UPI001687B7D1|nr:hypothetical protein [Trichocoleus sp. FACHB-40]MBD2001698.1 hypothetical protein [Trichocoleus sp. FACHB-40]